MLLNDEAPIANLGNVLTLFHRLQNREQHESGIGYIYGKSGLGKTTAAIKGANTYKAYFVRFKSVWTRKYFCQMILREMGIPTAKTIPEMLDQIAEELATSNRPLIIDEADFLLEKKMLEIVRDIYDSSFSSIILIGEENLPSKLKKFERFHNRVLDYVEAVPCNKTDMQILAEKFCPYITIDDDLLEKLNQTVQGCTRRVVANLGHIKEYCKKQGLDSINASLYKGKIVTGEPIRR